jgi:hypothetical protein
MGVFITGMHRAGLSVVARILGVLGYNLGEHEAEGAAKPDGEGSSEIVQINNQVLSTGRASWDWPQPLEQEFWEKGRATYHRKWVEQSEQLLSRLDQQRPWALKDPRMCLALPFWKDLAPSAQYLICLRNPFEVAHSLSQRHHLSENFGIQLWQQYYERLLSETQPGQRLVVDYNALLENSGQQVSRLIDWLEVNVGHDELVSALRLIKPDLRHQRMGDCRERLNLPRFSRAREVYAALSAEASQAAPRFYCPVENTPPEPQAALPISQVQSADSSPDARKVIIHYHLYKNAGSSVDNILHKNFGNEVWAKWEGDTKNGYKHRVSSEEMAAFIIARPEVVAISSHVADIAPPKLDNVQVFPIVFLRHPLDRIASVYHFERKQQIDALAPNKAKALDFKGYVEWRLTSDRVFRNFQTMRLAVYAAVPKDQELAYALKALSELPFVGLVECFGESVARLENWLKPYFPGFVSQQVRANSTSDPKATLEQRLENLREQLGDELYARLVEENADDLALHRAAMETWGC